MLTLKAKIFLATPLLLFVFLVVPQTVKAETFPISPGLLSPSRDQCNNAKNPAACKKDYDNCGNGSSDKIKRCRANAIGNALAQSLPQIGSAKQISGKKKSAAKTKDGYQCGNLPDDNDNVRTKINFGCLGSKAPAGMGPIQDLVFALIRFFSVGVGIAVTLSLIIAGIQYTTAEGNPESSQKAKLRAQQALIGLAIYIFSWSLLQFLIPGGLFNT